MWDGNAIPYARRQHGLPILNGLEEVVKVPSAIPAQDSDELPERRRLVPALDWHEDAVGGNQLRK
jgi:hypothetical protein